MPDLKAIKDILDEILPVEQEGQDPVQNRFNRSLREGSDIGLIYTKLAFYMQIDTLEKLFAAVGPVPITANAIGGDHYVNGQIVQLNFSPLISPFMSNNLPQFPRLIERLPSMGLGFLTGVDSEHSWLFDYLMASRHRIDLSHSYSGEFPSLNLNSRRIDNPELVLALQEKSKGSIYAESYKQILCWVPENVSELHSQFPNTYTPIKRLFLRKKSEPLLKTKPYLNLDQASQEDIEKIQKSTDYEYQGFELRAMPTGESTNLVDHHLLQEMGSPEINHGLGFKKGFVLCRVNLDKLKDFSIADPDPDKMEKAFRYVESYAPIGVMSSLVSTDRLSRRMSRPQPLGINAIGGEFGSIDRAVRKILTHIGNKDALGRAFQSAIDPEVLKFMVVTPTLSFRCEPCLDLKRFMVAHRDLGIETSKINARFKGNEITEFMASDVTISSDTNVIWSELRIRDGKHTSLSAIEFKNGLTKEDFLCSPGFAGELFLKGARIINGHDLSDVKNSMSGLARAVKKGDHNWVMIHTSRIRTEGLEACVQLARSPLQWTGLEKALGREAIEPYLSQTPKKYRASMLSEDLGL